jgi:hypothetical protein
LVVNGPDAPSDGLEAVVAAGKRQDSLEAIRDHLAAALMSSQSARESAVVARELRETIRELDSLGVVEVDDVDDIAAQRAKRRAGATA